MLTLKDIDFQNISDEKLGEILIEAKKAYYTSSKPIMDDHTYDTLEDILKKRNPYHRIFTKVGNEDFDTGFDKKKHQMPMGSQNKVNTYEELVHYFELKKIPDNSSFTVQPKCDGISLEIIYQKGSFVEAITRGDGEIGDLISQNVVKMQNFKKNLNHDFSGSIRTEIVVTYKDFDKLNQISDEKYSNPRNAASGLSQRLDSKYAEFCSIFAVDIYSRGIKLNSESEKMDLLEKLGIKTVKTYKCQNFPSIEEIYQKYLNQERQLFAYDIDGLVIKIDDLQVQKNLSSHNNRPKGQVAYKFPPRSQETTIKSINWQVGPMGMITPVAKLDPIEVSGAIITFASLANYDLIKEKNINILDVVEISRRGDVIPHVEKVISKVTPGHFLAPTKCPSCNTPLVTDNKFLRCPNLSSCPAQILGSLKLFLATLNIKGISDKTVEKLFNAGLVKLPGDFYKLQISDFKNLDGLGDKSGTNLVRQIQAKKELTLKQVFDAAIIPNFSAARIQQLISAGFDTPQKILNITPKILESLPGIQKILARKIHQGIRARQEFIQSILSHVHLRSSTHHLSSQISGKTFAITGTLSTPRKEIEELIQNQGGKIVSTVTPSTDYLITNDTKSNSSKFTAAQKFGTKIISEVEFQKLSN